MIDCMHQRVDGSRVLGPTGRQVQGVDEWFRCGGALRTTETLSEQPSIDAAGSGRAQDRQTEPPHGQQRQWYADADTGQGNRRLAIATSWEIRSPPAAAYHSANIAPSECPTTGASSSPSASKMSSV